MFHGISCPVLMQSTPGPDQLVSKKQGDVVRIVERVLKLAIPSLYVWLLIFAGLFHVGLNIAAELTLFGDREFYKVQPPMLCMLPSLLDILIMLSKLHCG